MLDDTIGHLMMAQIEEGQRSEGGVKNLDAMTPEEKQEIAMALNRQALEAVGYKEVRTSEGTA